MIGEVTRYVPICSRCEWPAKARVTRAEALAQLWPGELCFACYRAVTETDVPAGNDVLPETASEKRPPAVSDTGHLLPPLSVEEVCRAFDVPTSFVMSTPRRRSRIARTFGTRRKAR